MAKIKFEEKIGVINAELLKRRSRWQLNVRSDLDFDDVQQIVRLHIWKKWHKWDQSRALEPWLNCVIKRQITNVLRNNYMSFSRPCLRCPANEDNELCAIYVRQCLECPLYAKWAKSKKSAYDVKLPLPLEHHMREIEVSSSNAEINYEDRAQIVHERVVKRLNKTQRKIYEMLYIHHLEEGEIAKRMNYKPTDEKRKTTRYKQLENYKKHFLSIAKHILSEGEIV